MNPWGGIKKALFVYTLGLSGALSMRCVAHGAHINPCDRAITRSENDFSSALLMCEVIIPVTFCKSVTFMEILY
jgi:hypothetical protein